jgi:uncharacterized protein YjiS (DUF1127 family)
MKAENLKLNQWQGLQVQPQGLTTIIARWIARARERNTLAHLDDIARRDLGISESDVWAETRKAPWQA